MELAVRQGFDVQRRLAAEGNRSGRRPGRVRAAARDAGQLSGAPRAAPARARARRRRAFAAIRAFLGSLPDSPERHDAMRLAADLLDLPPETQAGLAPARGGARTAGVVSPRLLDAGQRLERSALAGVAAQPRLARSSASSAPSTSTTRCTAARARTCSGDEPADGELTSLLAELYALGRRGRASASRRREQLLLRLRERGSAARARGRRGRPARRPAAGALEDPDGDPSREFAVGSSLATMAAADPR